MARIRIVQPGLLTTVQDRGRIGYGHLGVTQGGALDGYALRWAQRLLALPATAAALEITLRGPTIQVQGNTSAALTGADLGGAVNGEPWPPGEIRNLQAGAIISFGAPRRGLRAYLAFRGGVVAERVLQSASTDLQSGVGGHAGRPLRAGDVLEVGDGGVAPVCAPVTTIRMDQVVRVLAGPRHELFPREALSLLTAEPFQVTPAADRVGLRLQGTRIPEAPGSILSEGMPIGAVEVPPDGAPIVLLAGRGTVGGYPVLATAISADLPVLAQKKPGDRFTFVLVTLEEARAALREQEAALQLPLTAV